MSFRTSRSVYFRSQKPGGARYDYCKSMNDQANGERKSPKDIYVERLRGTLAPLRSESVSVDRVESFILDIDEIFDLQERRGRTALAISESLGSPRKMAHAFAAYAVVRSSRPAFTLGARIALLKQTVYHHLLARPFKAIFLLLSSLLISLAAIFGWLFGALCLSCSVVGIYELLANLELSPELENGALFFFLGTILFSYVVFRVSRRATFFTSSLLWALWRRSSSSTLEKLMGEPR